MKFLAFLFLPLIGFSQTQTEKVSLGDKATLSIPKGLGAMSAEMWTLKYRDRKRPALVLTDADGEVNLIGEQLSQPLNDSQVEMFTELQLGQLRKRRTDLTVLSNGVKTVDGKKVGYIKFLSQAVDQAVFNYYFFAVADGKVLFFTFNCIEKLRKDWEKDADDIVASLKTK